MHFPDQVVSLKSSEKQWYSSRSHISFYFYKWDFKLFRDLWHSPAICPYLFGMFFWDCLCCTLMHAVHLTNKIFSTLYQHHPETQAIYTNYHQNAELAHEIRWNFHNWSSNYFTVRGTTKKSEARNAQKQAAMSQPLKGGLLVTSQTKRRGSLKCLPKYSTLDLIFGKLEFLATGERKAMLFVHISA